MEAPRPPLARWVASEEARSDVSVGPVSGSSGAPEEADIVPFDPGSARVSKSGDFTVPMTGVTYHRPDQGR